VSASAERANQTAQSPPAESRSQRRRVTLHEILTRLPQVKHELSSALAICSAHKTGACRLVRKTRAPPSLVGKRNNLRFRFGQTESLWKRGSFRGVDLNFLRHNRDFSIEHRFNYRRYENPRPSWNSNRFGQESWKYLWCCLNRSPHMHGTFDDISVKSANATDGKPRRPASLKLPAGHPGASRGQ